MVRLEGSIDRQCAKDDTQSKAEAPRNPVAASKFARGGDGDP